MKKTFFIVSLFLLFAWIQAIRIGYQKHKELQRAKSNYAAELSGLRSYYKGKIKAYQVTPQHLTRADAKELFSEEIERLEKSMKLRRVSQIIKIESAMAGTVKLELRDTTLHRVRIRQADTIFKARVFSYQDSNIHINGMTISDSIDLEYKVFPKIEIIRSLEPRQNFWKKATLQPLRRKSIYTIIPGDPRIDISRFSVLEID